MKKYAIASAIAAIVTSLSLHAQSNPQDIRSKYFTAPAVELTAQEKAALSIAQKWQAATATGIKPVAGTAGAVHFFFGVQKPVVVCAVLQVLSAG